MNALLIGVMLMGFAGDPEPVAFEFRDAIKHEGRSMVHYRTIGFKRKPLQEFAEPFKAPKGARYALLELGADKDHSLAVVWVAKGKDGPTLWVDANGDDRLDDSERCVMKKREIEIPVSVVVETKPRKEVTRTLLFKRPLFGGGLRYAVRGYAVGKIDLGGEQHDAILVDGNANVTFGTIGHDRVWIDLDRNGRFDGLTEQFALGRPIRKGEHVYIVRSNRTGTEVSAKLRKPGEGKLKLVLAKGMKVDKVSAELISDLGELIEINQLDKPAPVPHGKYYIASLTLKSIGPKGQPWHYSFRSGKRRRTNVGIGEKATMTLLDGLRMRVRLGYSRKNEAKPGETVSVRPEVTTRDRTLTLSDCTRGSEDSRDSAEASAVILFMSPKGKTLSRGISGFG